MQAAGGFGRRRHRAEGPRLPTLRGTKRRRRTSRRRKRGATHELERTVGILLRFPRSFLLLLHLPLLNCVDLVSGLPARRTVDAVLVTSRVDLDGHHDILGILGVHIHGRIAPLGRRPDQRVGVGPRHGHRAEVIVHEAGLVRLRSRSTTVTSGDATPGRVAVAAADARGPAHLAIRGSADPTPAEKLRPGGHGPDEAITHAGRISTTTAATPAGSNTTTDVVHTIVLVISTAIIGVPIGEQRRCLIPTACRIGHSPLTPTAQTERHDSRDDSQDRNSNTNAYTSLRTGREPPSSSSITINRFNNIPVSARHRGDRSLAVAVARGPTRLARGAAPQPLARIARELVGVGAAAGDGVDDGRRRRRDVAEAVARGAAPRPVRAALGAEGRGAQELVGAAGAVAARRDGRDRDDYLGCRFFAAVVGGGSGRTGSSRTRPRRSSRGRGRGDGRRDGLRRHAVVHALRAGRLVRAHVADGAALDLEVAVHEAVPVVRAAHGGAVGSGV